MIYLILLAVTMSCSKLEETEVKHKIGFLDVATASGTGSILVAVGLPQQFKPLVDFVFAPVRLPFKAINYMTESLFKSITTSYKEGSGQAKLLTSIRKGDFALAQKTLTLKEGKCNVNEALKFREQGEEKTTYFLHFAVANRAPLPIIELIIQEGNASANAYLKDSDGKTALIVALENKNMEAAFRIIDIIKKNNSDIADLEKVGGMHPIHIASAFGKIDMINLMCEKHLFLLTMDSEIKVLDESLTALDFAALFGQENAVKRILQLGGSEQAKKENIKLTSKIAFNLAAAVGSIKICEQLLESGIGTSKVKKNNVLHFLGLKSFFKDYITLNSQHQRPGFTELIPLKEEKESILDFLQPKLDLELMLFEENDEEDTPIETAAQFGDYKLVKRMMEKIHSEVKKQRAVRALRNIAEDELDSRLVCCIDSYLNKKDRLDIFKFFATGEYGNGEREDFFALLSLLKKHDELKDISKDRLLEDVDPFDKEYIDKILSLHCIATSSSQSLMAIVLHNDIASISDINEVDKSNKSYAEHCVELGNLEMLEFLIEKGVKLSFSLLSTAVKGNFFSITRLLLTKLFADTSNRNFNDERLLDLVDKEREWLIEDLVELDIKTQNKKGQNLAMVVLGIRNEDKHFCEDFLKEILDSSDLNHIDNESNTLFHLCVQNNQISEIEILLQRSQNHNRDTLWSKNKSKESPLDMAIRLDNDIIVCKILRAYPEEKRAKKLGLVRFTTNDNALSKAKEHKSEKVLAALQKMKEAESAKKRDSLGMGDFAQDFEYKTSIAAAEDMRADLFKYFADIIERMENRSEVENKIKKAIESGDEFTFELRWAQYLKSLENEFLMEHKQFIIECLIICSMMKKDRMLLYIFDLLSEEERLLTEMLEYQTVGLQDVSLLHFAPLLIDKSRALEIVAKAREVDQRNYEGLSPLMTAASFGQFELCKLLIEKGADVNGHNSYNATPLIFAAQGGDLEVCKILLQKGADVNAASLDGITPLLMALAKKHLGISELLVEHGAEVNCSRNNGITPLMIASKMSPLKMCQLLLDKGANVNAENENGLTPLMFASARGRIDVCELLLERGAIIDKKDFAGNSSLTIAAQGGDLETCRTLLQKGADVNAASSDGITPLMLAAIHHHTETCRLLIEKGAEVEAKDLNGNTALMLAALKGHFDICDLLVEASAEVNAENLNGVTAIMMAAEHGHLKVCKLLIDKKADIDIRNVNKATALVLAAEKGHFELCKLLIENRADVNAQCANETNSLILALNNNHLKICELLIDHEVNVNAISYNKITPLLIASGRNYIEMCKLLIDRNANVNAKDFRGLTPIMLAAQNGNFELCELLVKNRANVNASIAKKEEITNIVGKPAANELRINIRFEFKTNMNVKAGQNAEAIDPVPGFTPLMFAAQHGHTRVCHLLLENGANVDAKCTDNSTALMIAAQKGHLGVCGLLADKGADMNSENIAKETPLIIALRNQNIFLCELLLEKKADVNLANHEGATPLVLAAKWENIDICRQLVRRGANINVFDQSRTTPLMFAALYGNFAMCKFFINCGVNINAVRCDKSTALMLAAARGDIRVCKLLIENGANISMIDQEDNTAAAIALKRGHSALYKMLTGTTFLQGVATTVSV